MADQNKEKVDEAIETLVSHYGRGICKWLVKKFPKATKSIATTVIFVVGGFMLYFVIGLSGEDPIDFVFDNISKEVFGDKTEYVDPPHQDDSTNATYKSDGWLCPDATNVQGVFVETEDPTDKIVLDTNGVPCAVWVKKEKK